MSKRGEFIKIVSTLRATSQFITNQQRFGFLRQGRRQYGLAADDAEGILKNFGFVVGERTNYFEVLGLSITEIQNQTETTVKNIVDEAHRKLYSASLRAGSRPRSDGKTQDQWRTILNQARDTLKDTQKRREHITILQDDGGLDNFPDDMVPIPAGEFQMGSNNNDALDNEKPQHTVYVDAFYMDMYEVTNAAYKEFIDANPDWRKDRIANEYHDGNYLHFWNGNNYPTGKDFHPVAYVSWYAAMAYAQWTGKRLPTEAEWEKAARGGLSNKKYPWGNFINPSKANYGSYVPGTTPVGSYSPNDYGLYDVSGNVWEWCLDAYNPNFYAVSSPRNPIYGRSIADIVNTYLNVKTRRMLRGGAWISKTDYLRVTHRGSGNPMGTNDNVGFRCVRTLLP